MTNTKLLFTQSRISKKSFKVTLSVVLLVFLQACGGSGSNDKSKTVEPTIEQARDPLNDLVSCKAGDTFSAVTLNTPASDNSAESNPKTLKIFQPTDSYNVERVSNSNFVFGNGTYLSPGTEMISLDGVNWQRRLIDAKVKDIRSLIFVNGLFYALFDGQIASSRDGLNWIQTQLPMSLAAIEHKDGTFVAITRAENSNNNHLILSSKDSKVWQARCSIPKKSDVVPRLSIVGSRIFTWGTIHLSSANGTDWTTSNVRTLSGVVAAFNEAKFTFKNGKYLAHVNSSETGIPKVNTKQCDLVNFEGTRISYCNAIFNSSDGINWLENESPIAGQIYSAVTANDTFHLFSTTADGRKSHSLSTDGKTWSAVTFNEFKPSIVRFQDGKWLGIEIREQTGYESIGSSTDGIHWKKLETIKDATFQAPVLVNGRFLLRADSNYGVESTAVIFSIDQNFSVKKSAVMEHELWPQQLSFQDGLFYLLGSKELLTSPDAKLWKTYSLPSGFSAFRSEYGNGKFLVFGEHADVLDSNSYRANFVLTSSDGENWQEARSPFGARLMSIRYGAGQFIALVGASKENYFDIYSSVDGQNWTLRNSVADVYRLKFINGKFIAFGKTIASSVDGINWKAEATPDLPEFELIIDLTFGDSKYALLTSSSKIKTSDDLSNWTQRESRAQGNVWGRSIGYANGQFVAIDRFNLMTSQNGINWNVSPYPNYDWENIVYGNGVWVAEKGTNIYYNLLFK